MATPSTAYTDDDTPTDGATFLVTSDGSFIVTSDGSFIIVKVSIFSEDDTPAAAHIEDSTPSTAYTAD